MMTLALLAGVVVALAPHAYKPLYAVDSNSLGAVDQEPSRELAEAKGAVLQEVAALEVGKWGMVVAPRRRRRRLRCAWRACTRDTERTAH